MIESPQATRDYLSIRLGTLEHEGFCCLYLDTRHRLIDCVEMFRGTVDFANVHPREIVREALLRNATAVIVAHNHPSGVAEPSRDDELLTQRLKGALALVDARLIDHLVVGGGEVIGPAGKELL